ncbi:HlyD family type I secretion periplasmic adaptor subunit [Planktotalea sp.]|uniref:HlyD family type I secretion periplasmic adaptor subunit n=1 Tax=Planktotalea sp. TaxID=2029877 RepID=UPI003F6AA9C9
MKLDPNPAVPSKPTKSKLAKAGKPLFIGYFSLAILVGVIGVWSVQARIAGAVIASGMIQVENNRQVVQHPQGGVVGELLVRDGDRVEAGDVVLRLDDALLRSELAIITAQLNETRARKGRLSAERDDADEISFDPELIAQGELDPAVKALMEGQARLFETRRVALTQVSEQLQNQIEQTGDQIEGARAQLTATQGQAELIISELEDAQTLLDKGLAQASRVSALRREDSRLQGEIGQYSSLMAQLKGDIARLNIEILRLSTQRREEAISGLRDLQFQENELVERALSTRATLSKMEVRSPVSGVIYGNTVFALQSVISPAAPIMYVIPQDQALIVSARVEAIHIDQVHEGQSAALRFVAFDQRTTPEVFGRVTRLSADVFTDEVTGISFYQAELLPEDDELSKLSGQQLVPGMPVEAFIKTQERSPLSYLMKPLMDYFNKAFREA